jgi:hypothetical protein
MMRWWILWASLVSAPLSWAADSTSFLFIPDAGRLTTNGSFTLAAAANQVICGNFVPTMGIANLTKVAWSAGAVAGNYGMCIYDATGATLLVNAGGVAAAAFGVAEKTALSPVSLVAGTKYRLCWVGDTLNWTVQASGSVDTILGNAYVTNIGTSAASSVAGACPTPPVSISTPSAQYVPWVMLATNTP